MTDSSTNELKDLKHELERIDHGAKGECTMCRLVLIFAFAVLLLVMIFVFFFRLNTAPPLQPLPRELTPPLNPALQQQQVIELGSVIHPELSKTPPQGTPARALPVKSQ